MCSANLPPLGNPPQWSRVVSLDNVPHIHSSQQHRLLHPLGQHLLAQDVETNKVAVLEKRLQFLEQTHTDTLGKLHQEIEQLKRENRDLQYQLIMSEKLSEKDSSTAESLKGSTQRSSSPDPGEVLQSLIGLTPHSSAARKQGTEEDDVKAEQGHSQTPRVKMERKSRHAHPREDVLEEQASSSAWTRPTQPRLSQACMPVISLNPLLVDGPAGQAPRAPTLLECEYIIHQLWNTNHIQADELLHLKTFLGKVVYNNKWTPESYLFAKALLCHPTRVRQVIRFPNIAAMGDPNKWVKAPVAFSDGVVLPAMKQTLGNSLVERQKRSQAMQRNRLKRTVL